MKPLPHWICRCSMHSTSMGVIERDDDGNITWWEEKTCTRCGRTWISNYNWRSADRTKGYFGGTGNFDSQVW